VLELVDGVLGLGVEDRAVGDHDDRIEELEANVKALEKDFEDKLQDGRQRIVQVKRELDEKTEVDQDYSALRDRIEELDPADLEERQDEFEQRISDLDDKLETLAASAITIQDQVDQLTRVDDVVDDHRSTINDLGETVEKLTSAVAETQQRVETLKQEDGTRNTLDRLFERANRTGVRRAACETCGEKIDIALLRTPSCPVCGEAFVDVEEGGLFRSGTLVTGSPPALDTQPSDDKPVETHDDAPSTADPQPRKTGD
jgi:chromosome segregation ATPase